MLKAIRHLAAVPSIKNIRLAAKRLERSSEMKHMVSNEESLPETYVCSTTLQIPSRE